MSVSVFTFAIVFTALFGGVIGGISGYVIGDRRASVRHLSRVESPGIRNQDVGFKFDTMMAKFHDLASDVGEQVDDYSVTIREITEAFKDSDDADGILRASKFLLETNQQLQSELAKAKAEIERQREELSHSLRESRTDALTGIMNRRAFDQELSRSVATYRRKQTVFTLVMIDIDHFKRLNDLHGHMIGDQVLKTFAKCLTGSFREMDFIFRYGGEEFAIILPQTSLQEALIAAERTRIAIAESYHAGSDTVLNVTASIGVKEVASHDTEESIVKTADEALYAAKHSGRNATWYHDLTGLRAVEETQEQTND